MSQHPKRLPERRPSEWATWQGRLGWAIDRAVESFPSISAASESWGFARTQLNTWRKRLESGGDLQFSTVAALQEHLHMSWFWLATGHGWPTSEVARTHGAPLRAVRSDDEIE